jgi:hypothetical protein
VVCVNTVHGFQLGDRLYTASDIQALALRSRRQATAAATGTHALEFYGDSITCGYGNEGTPPCDFTAGTENNWLSWGPMTARALNASVHVEAWSGKGVVRYGLPLCPLPPHPAHAA